MAAPAPVPQAEPEPKPEPAPRGASPAPARVAPGLPALQQVAALIDAGRAHDALTLARDLFAHGDLPPWLVADLCSLAGTAAFALGLAEVAEQMWRRALLQARAQEPAPVPGAAAVQLARLLASQQRDDEAEACCRLALERGEPAHHLDAWLLLGGLLARRRRHAEAESCYEAALRIDPRSAAAHTDLGLLLGTLKRPADSERHLREALALDPRHAAAWTNLGLLLATLKRPAEAEACQREALACAPAGDSEARAAIHSNLGNLLADLGRLDEAEANQRTALALAPASAAAHCNLGVLLRNADRPQEAEAALRRALALRPDHLLAQLHLGALLLARGDWAEGWRLHEARHHPGLPDNGIPPPALGMPRWRGEALDGKSVLVWPEQGLGDQIQFARFAPLLKARGAARVTLVCQRPLKALFDSLEGVDAVCAADIADNRFQVADADLRGHDLWVFPLSLPHELGIELSNLPAPIPYLRAPAERLADWAARFGPRRAARRIGLVWRGNPRHDNDGDRSLPGLATLAPLWSLPDVEFTSLQAGRAGDVAHEPLPCQPLRHFGDALGDFADTAAALQQLDLLICVDTSIAHLAGALGRPCWVLLPWHKTDWRWLLGRDDSPWYPGMMRLFRQPRRGDWAAVVEALRAALAAAPPLSPCASSR